MPARTASVGGLNVSSHLRVDVIPTLEYLLDAEEIDYEECAAADGPWDICGATPCQECGCLVDKLARAKALLASPTDSAGAEA